MSVCNCIIVNGEYRSMDTEGCPIHGVRLRRMEVPSELQHRYLYNASFHALVETLVAAMREYPLENVQDAMTVARVIRNK